MANGPNGRIHLIGQAAALAVAENENLQRKRAAGLTREQIKIDTLQIMIKQFRVQCNSVPQGDPARTVVEMLLDAFEKVLA